MEPQSEVSLSDIFGIIRKHFRLFFILLSGVVLAALAATFLIPPSYRSSARLIIESENNISPGGLMPTASDESYLNTQKEILSSGSILQQALADVQERGFCKNQDFDSGKLKVKATYLTGSNILDVSVYYKNAKEAAELANALVRAFFKYHTKARVDVVEKNLIAVSSATGAIKKRLTEIEVKLKESKDKEQLIFYQGQIPSYTHDILVLEQQNIQMQESIKRFKDELARTRQSVESGKAASFYPLLPQAENPTVSMSTIPWIGDIKSKMVSVEADISGMGQEYTDNNPEIVKLRGRLEGIQTTLNQELQKVLTTYEGYYRGSIQYLESMVSANNAERAHFEEQLKSLSAKITEAAGRQIEYAVLLKQYDTLSEVYTVYAKKQGEWQLLKEQAMSTSFPNIRLLESAVAPHKPAIPNVPLNMMTAVCLGLLIGVSGCLLQERKEGKKSAGGRQGGSQRSSQQSSENRGMSRIARSCPVKYSSEELRLPEKPAYTANISGSGMCMEARERLRSGELVAFEIKVSDEMTVSAAGKVVWVKPADRKGMYNTGIAFTKIISQEREKLIQYLYGAGQSLYA